MSSRFFQEVVVKGCTKTSNLGGVFPMVINVVVDVSKRITTDLEGGLKATSLN